jgi:hypothetical protein
MSKLSPRPPRSRLSLCWPAALLAVLLGPVVRAQDTPPPTAAQAATIAAQDTTTEIITGEREPPHSALVQFVDGLPDLMNFALPTVGPNGMFRLYVHPHFGDFLHKDYLRLPVGTQITVMPHVEASAELDSYFTHGLRGSDGDGLYEMLLGLKTEHQLDDTPDAGWNTGINFSTPLSRPPLELSDGYRHTLPYIGTTYPVVRKHKVVGYTTLGADLLNHTALPSMFGFNQLHGNSLSFITGVAKDFSRYQLSMTASYATTRWMSNENNEVFGLHPSIVIPVRPLKHSRMKALVTFTGRAIWGPDGRETGISTSLRVEFDIKPH